MEHDGHSVGGQLGVQLEVPEAQFQRLVESGEGILRSVIGRAPVGDDEK